MSLSIPPISRNVTRAYSISSRSKAKSPQDDKKFAMLIKPQEPKAAAKESDENTAKSLSADFSDMSYSEYKDWINGALKSGLLDDDNIRQSMMMTSAIIRLRTELAPQLGYTGGSNYGVSGYHTKVNMLDVIGEIAEGQHAIGESADGYLKLISWLKDNSK